MISVIMAVYNEQKEWVKESIESILNQTYANFEYIIILDNPDNLELRNLIDEYKIKDSRIKFFVNKKNIGLTNTLNKALKYCNGSYIARMDADDISLKHRFMTQFNYMKNNNVDIIGSNIIEFSNNYAKSSNFKLSNKDIKENIFLGNQLAHPTWFVKREVLLDLKYRDIYACEDYDLILRAIKKGYIINNISECLLKYRINNNGISRKNLLIQKLISVYLANNFNRIENVTTLEVKKLIENNKDYKRNENYCKAAVLKQKIKKTNIYIILFKIFFTSPLFFKLNIIRKIKFIIKKRIKKIFNYIKSLKNNILKIIKKIIKYNLLIFFRILPVNNNKVIFVNYFGKGYGDSSKYIIDEILRQNKEINIIYAISDNIDIEKFPVNVKTVKIYGIKYLYHMSTSKIWVDNCRKYDKLLKRNKQVYIQTWHGGIPLKKIEGDAADKLSINYIECAKRDTKMTDIMISNSSFCTEIYRRAFWYDGIIKEYGTPRNDILLDEKKQNKIKPIVFDNLGLNKNDKILLYAPTFRNSNNLDYYKLDFDNLLKYLNNKSKENWKILIRLHPNISDKSNELYNYSDNIINVTDYDDMYELMVISDILITDYSSVMFEFSFMKKPVFLYANDINEYIDERGFYFDYFRLPYSVSKDYDELINNINHFDEKKYKEDIDKFNQEIGLKESGKAAELVAKDIIKIIEGDKIEK